MRMLLIIFGVVACLLVGLFIFVRIAVKKDLRESKTYITYSRMMFTASDCDKYKAKYGLWPNSIDQLIQFKPELVDWAKDAFGQDDEQWGNYVVLVPYDNSLGYGKIISYGQDGKPGGVDLDRDLEVRFPSEANSGWNKQQGVGLKPPRFRQ